MPPRRSVSPCSRQRVKKGSRKLLFSNPKELNRLRMKHALERGKPKRKEIACSEVEEEDILDVTRGKQP